MTGTFESYWFLFLGGSTFCPLSTAIKECYSISVLVDIEIIHKFTQVELVTIGEQSVYITFDFDTMTAIVQDEVHELLTEMLCDTD